ncbi:MAG: 50S ribosomal protein L21 [Bacteroidia bacterium]|nr:50S ribosomal protein L21 [Bacteroidia bacterium]
MFAIVNIAGRQVKVEEGKSIYVNLLDKEAGATLSFDEVLLKGDDNGATVGTPFLSGSSVKATVEEHVKGPKIIVFKKKRRKGYAVKNGHRQQYSKIKIESIG